MSAVLEVITHDINCTNDWPESISELATLLRLAIPSPHYRSDEVRGVLSSGVALKMYDELLHSPLLGIEETNEAKLIDRRILDVLDMLLSSVELAKSTIFLSTGEIQSRSSWTSIIALLGMALSEDIFITEESSFLTPRTKARPNDVGDLEGKADILLSVLLPRSLKGDGSEPMDVDESDVGYLGVEETAFEDPFVTLDVSFDAHVIPGRGKRVDCLFPVVCAAQEDMIETLVTSVVCQRCVWKMSHPVVGISLSNCSTIARILIGWAERRAGEDTPTIHLAYASRTTSSHPSVGVFDIVDPASVLCFVQFIVGLDPYFSSVKQDSGRLDTSSFCWRLDHTCYDHGLGTEVPVSSGAGFNAWVGGLSEAENPESPASLPQSHSLYAMAPNPKVSKAKSTSSKRSTKDPKPVAGSSKLTTPPSVKSLPTITTTGASDDDEKSKKEVKPPTPSTLKSYYSASAFAKLKPGSEAGPFPPGTDTWLWDRSTMRIFRVKMRQGDILIANQIDSMIGLYDDVTQFCWPKKWRTESDIPASGAFGDKIRARLFTHYEQYKKENTGIPEMPVDLAAAIESRLPILYQTASQAAASQKLARIKEAPEAAMRTVWDSMLRAMWNPIDRLSTTVFFEKTIPLPKNQATALGDRFNGPTQANLYNILASAQTFAAAKTRPPRQISDALRLASQKAGSLSDSLNNYTPADRSFEPTSARVDAMCCLEFALPPSTEKWKLDSADWWKPFFKSKENPETQPKRGHIDPDETECLPLYSPIELPGSTVDFPRLYIPSLFAEYKKNDITVAQASNQARLYCSFGVHFLFALGVTDHPVWALVGTGIQGFLAMAWMSSERPPDDADPNDDTKYSFIMDGYTRSFDLTQPLQIFQFMSTVYRIHMQQKILMEVLSKKLQTSKFMTDHPFVQEMMTPKHEKESKTSITDATSTTQVASTSNLTPTSETT